ncbi:GNAT family N-acetyltransferase [Colwellia ponticola]|uniref:GNAT family N-acetyltransferase n=1 Tax=Colwellia ponticola TaxID=2304625 RepID=UPI001486AE43|nr:GNAT family N-acetyltransferase [Colwellia ponticola]
MHSFTTQRLLIRPLAKEDEHFFSRQYSNAKVMRHNGGALTPIEANKAFFHSLKANQRAISAGKKSVITWAIVCKSSNSIIGTQTFSFLMRPHNAKIMNQTAMNETKQAEIGIVLCPKANGKLFPEEAMGALMEYGFTYLYFDKINAFYASKNLATKRFVKKLGFIYNRTLQDDNPENCYQYAVKCLWQKKFICHVY